MDRDEIEQIRPKTQWDDEEDSDVKDSWDIDSEEEREKELARAESRKQKEDEEKEKKRLEKEAKKHEEALKKKVLIWRDLALASFVHATAHPKYSPSFFYV